MSNQRKKIVDLICSGVSVELAFEIAKSEDNENGGEIRISYLIAPRKNLNNLPDPQCVAARLKEAPNPTRADIEAAFEACSK